MPRENSFSDSDGRSLTPDISDDEGVGRPVSPTYSNRRSQSGSRPPHPQTTKPSILQKSAPAVLTQRTNDPGRTTTSRPPNKKFRSVVQKVIAMRRGTSIMSLNAGLSNAGPGVVPGAEPGVDPRRDSANFTYGGIHQDCTIEIFDYSSVRSSFGRMSNQQFVSLMEDPGASDREPWAKVRWINIGGMSWDVMKAVSIKYSALKYNAFYDCLLTIHIDLHPLALEDVFHARKQTRSKADYYPTHLFLRVLCHELDRADSNPAASKSTPPQSDAMLHGQPVYDEPLGMIAENSSEYLGKGHQRNSTLVEDGYGEDPSTNGGLKQQARRGLSLFKKKRPVLPRYSTDASAFSTISDLGDPVSGSRFRASIATHVLLLKTAYRRRMVRQEEVALDALRNVCLQLALFVLLLIGMCRHKSALKWV